MVTKLHKFILIVLIYALVFAKIDFMSPSSVIPINLQINAPPLISP